MGSAGLMAATNGEPQLAFSGPREYPDSAKRTEEEKEIMTVDRPRGSTHSLGPSRVL